jgi:hypothetical protein
MVPATYICPGRKLRKRGGMTFGFHDRKHLWTPMYKHFIKNDLRLHHPIAAYRDTGGNLVALTQSKFVQRINEILGNTKKNHPRISGHCFQIGGTTFYLISGVPPDMVKKFGRWRSQAFLEYWRCLDYLGAIHIEMLPLKPQAHKHLRTFLRA